MVHSRLPELQPMEHAPDAAAAAAGSAVGAAPPGAGARLTRPEYHVSLSRTVQVRQQQIESLVAVLGQQLRKLDTFCIRLGAPEASGRAAAAAAAGTSLA